jgi:multiple RNA-binding domain-containing protein 1
METSRIFIRGLPPNLSEDEFKAHFSKLCPVTDAKFIPRRRIGYVGYKTPADAAKAVKYFDRSFIRMSRIAVELARPVRNELRSGVYSTANDSSDRRSKGPRAC